ncbi:hypothetical protein MMC26_000608 [Xylographa opegraphella]|nr:hypothetical protein [Xylographa opegraphella]
MTNSLSAQAQRPFSLQSSKSFTRYEPSKSEPRSRNRASSLRNGVAANIPGNEKGAPVIDQQQGGDVFEKRNSEEDRRETKAIVASTSVEGLPEGFDELPIELISLTDRFIASLTAAKVYSTPPSIERLSDLFQDFYLQADSHISTHIQELSSRQYRDGSPAISASSRTSASTRANNKLMSKQSKDSLSVLEKIGPEQQMLTASEVSERRRARRMLEQKRLALEEAVERRVTEGVYDRIWRHGSTLDEIRDEKLRSKTAALALVGIGLKDLGIDFDVLNKPSVSPASLAAQVEEWIAKAREGLLKMNDSRNPLGKLQSLASTHQNIVDLLTDLHQSSSSADEILPTLIYTLITSPTEGINVISNLHFIQRFRSQNKIDGEAAYCLTNLEAAITFLETVDLASLRADEALEGPTKPSSRPSTPRSESSSAWSPGQPTSASISSSATTPLTAVPSHLGSVPMSHPLRSPTNSRPSPPVSPSHERRLSNIFQPPAKAFGAASDAVRTTADTGFRHISNTLDGSFKLLFGRLKEQHLQGEGTDAHGTIIVPKTLDDARKLVSPRPVIDEDGTISESSSFADHDEDASEIISPKPDDRLLDLISGRKPSRDRSVDSVVSTTSSGRRVAFASDAKLASERAGSPAPPSAPVTSTPPFQPNAAVESMRNLGNSLNPLNRLAGMNVMRGFGRSTPATPSPAPLLPSDQARELSPGDKASLPIEAPVQRFLDVGDASNLKIGDVSELLKDYQRLAGVVKSLGLY